jgi:anti-sigma regulatory factor (Ser/Thr protein kinase)
VLRRRHLDKGGAFGNNIPNISNENQEEKIYAPVNFSMIDNKDEFMCFLYKVDASGWKGKNILIDLSRIKNITPDGLLIIIAYLSHYKRRHPELKIDSNYPLDSYCFNVFVESGFYHHVFTNSTRQQSDKDLLSVRSDTTIRSDEAGAVLEFVRRKLGINDKVLTRAVYKTIMESMTNVRDHAYINKEEKNYGWWLMALPDRDGQMIRFALIDNGKGIPRTIKKKNIENLGAIRDEVLIRAAIFEEDRSSTRLSFRGKGLPAMKKLVDSKKIRNLHIISRKGGFLIDEDKLYNLNGRQYYGTIISWEFIKDEE